MILSGQGLQLSLPGSPERVVDITFSGANPDARPRGEDLLPGVSNVLLGNDPSKWRRGIPHYRQVRVPDLYPGIDAVYYGKDRDLEFDLELRPGSHPDAIAIHYAGAAVSISSAGDLLLQWEGGALLVQHAPEVYQKSSTGKVPVRGRYTVDDTGTVRVELGPYDPEQALVIDPVLTYGSLLGGTGIEGYSNIAVDASGNMYVTYNLFGIYDGGGNYVGPSIPHVPASGSGVMAAEKYSADGKFIWATLFGGVSSACCIERILQLVVDAQGQLAMVGFTSRSDFPLKNALYQGIVTPQQAPFVLKLNAAGSDFLFSTFFGGVTGTKVDGAKGGLFGVGTDSAGNTYVGGSVTVPSALIVTPNNFMNLSKVPTVVSQYAFAAKFDGNGGLLYSVLIGATGGQSGGYCIPEAIAVDAPGNLYMTGQRCTGLEVTQGAYVTALPTSFPGFAAKLNPAGTDLLYATFLPGMYMARGIAVDSTGAAYVLGDMLQSAGFTTTSGVYRPSLLDSPNNPWPALTKLNPAGTAQIFATYIGLNSALSGSAPTFPRVFVDNSFKPWLVYTTSDNAEILTGAVFSHPWVERLTQYNPVIYRTRNTYAVRLSADASTLEFGTFVNSTPPGSTSTLYYDSAAMDPQGNLFVTGPTDMLPLLTPNAYQSTNGGGGYSDIYIVGISNSDTPTSCTYSVTSDVQPPYPFIGGDLTLMITPTPISGSCQWNLTGLPSWIQAWPESVPGTSGTGAGIMQFSLTQNGSTIRTAVLSVGGTFDSRFRRQASVACTTQLIASSLPIGSAGVTGVNFGFTVSPASCGWLATTAAPWLSVSSNQAGTGNSSVTFSVSANSGGPRSGTILVNNQAFTVTQSGLPSSLSIAKNHQGVFFVDQSGAAYTVTVGNQAGAGPTSGLVTVTETVPPGMTLVSMAGTGWTCPTGGSTCTRSDALPAGATYPPIAVTVNIASNAAASVINHVDVSGGGSPGAGADNYTDLSPLTCNVNGDSVKDVTDLQLILNEALGISTTVHDMNHDGSIDVADIQKVVLAVLGFGCR